MSQLNDYTKNNLEESVLSPEAIEALNGAAMQSPFLAGLLNDAASSGIVFEIGAPEGGTFYSPSTRTVTIASSWQPGLPTGESPLGFATTIAHELAHAVLNGAESAPLNSPTLARTIGGENEDVALAAEYIVSKQLGLGAENGTFMHSDSGQSGQPPRWHTYVFP